ncbi:hypothetical protein C8J57DRAFT_1490530 [Mycena rebaudengoi]|nr:hypothetical protein C8J57DRAFT_1490530 [Mycena rebaudengoi]
MPCTVKATHHSTGELRKLSFSSFPTYEQLYNQLYRIFPISHNYYLSKLLFSPDSSKSSILIAREIHNAEQYNQATAPYAAGNWPNAMLRFSIFNETPHKLPNGFVPDNTPATGASNPFISLSHIPPPPVILSSTAASTPQAPMDIDCWTPDQSQSTLPSSSSTPKPQHQQRPQSESSCCASSLGTPEPMTPLAPLPVHKDMFPGPPSSFCLFKYCTTCAKIFQGPWFACEKCSIVVCTGCHETRSTPYCVAAMGPHIMKKELCAACPGAAPAANLTPPNLRPHVERLCGTPAHASAPMAAVDRLQSLVPLRSTDTGHAIPDVAQVPEAPAPPPPPPVIHFGVICDMCDNTVEGIRHKCLDCPNYDLCTPCIASGSAERHNPFHEFLEIREPGRVIVHTVYDGDRDVPAPPAPPAPVPQEAAPEVHYATCNLCDSRIRGDRYKCADCPDFDTCSNCFSITREQHPRHAFVKLTKATDYIRREAPAAPMHFVTCNACSKAIFGGCEAFPIAVHPDNHPLLKMRSPSTVVPTVYRVGQTTLIERDESERGRSPAPVLRQRSRSPKPQLHAPYVVLRLRAEPHPAAVALLSSAPRARASSSPVQAYHPSYHPPAPPMLDLPRPTSPMMMPGGLYDEPSVCSRFPPLFAQRPQPTASRFSHSPSPSPPLFSHPLPPAPPVWGEQRWEHYPAFPVERQATMPATYVADPQPERQHTLPTAFRERARSELHMMRDRLAEEQEEQMRAQEAEERTAERVSYQWNARAAPVSTSEPAPAVDPIFNTFRSYWPKSSEELRHLMQDQEDAFASLSLQEPAVMDSPLTGEGAVEPPRGAGDGPDEQGTDLRSTTRLRRCLMATRESAPVRAPTPLGLRAGFIIDVTLPDGQNFPPGAEFMKCWKMANSGGVPWPAETELVYVAGEPLAREHGGPQNVVVGSLEVGEELDLWTGELKAPETPGRYVSYWRLRDGQGNLFGESIWIDINVTEATRSHGSTESSLSSSSIIVMPQAAQSAGTSSVAAEAQRAEVGSSWSQSPIVRADDDDASSEHGSDASSVSLISVPTSEDDDWAASRVAVAADEGGATEMRLSSIVAPLIVASSAMADPSLQQMLGFLQRFVHDFTYPQIIETAKNITYPGFADGRFDITGTFVGNELNTEYIFGLFSGLATGASVSTPLLGTPLNETVTGMVVNGNVIQVSSVRDFNWTASIRAPVRFDFKFMFNDQGLVTQYDGGIFRSVATFDDIWSRLAKTRAARDICSQHEKFCLGDLVQYNSTASCIDFVMTQMPFGEVWQGGQNTAFCRYIHTPMLPFRPAVHCPHIGPTGGDMCFDHSIEQMILDNPFPKPFVALPGGLTLHDLGLT